MQIFLGADHRGFALKNQLKTWLEGQNYQVIDKGNLKFDSHDDYPDFAQAVAKEVAKNTEHRGILLCGSGAGVVIAANKIKNARAFASDKLEQIAAARQDDDINILALAADFIDLALAKNLVKVFLNSKFEKNARHLRRLKKIL